MYYLKAAAAALAALILWAGISAYSTLNGWWHSAIVASDADARVFMNAATTFADERNAGNVAMVLIEDGVVLAEHFAGVSQNVDADTLFATASMSKWITALGVMNLVQDGKFDLDTDIADYLTRWQLPPSEFDNTQVTVRRLLSHMAGLTDGLGFGDYLPDEAVPSLEASLQQPRASSGTDVSIAVGREPGTEWDYSGGGYLILQLLIEEVSDQSFADYMQTALFTPLAMSRSTYGYIGTLPNSSRSFDTSGAVAPTYQYAASAATGFATSMTDLTRLVTAQISTSAEAAMPLSKQTLEAMRAPEASLTGFDIWGLGTILYAPTASGDFIYGHDGQNEPAINAAVRINPDSADAIMVLASGNPSLATQIGFEWVLWQTGVPDFLGIGPLISTGMRIFVIGAVVILVFAVLMALRQRRRWGNANPGII